MSQPDEQPIDNAEEVIERFGGIRPMATKMDVPVTTVQGWKKRNVIPGNRRGDVMNAAARNNIDVSDLLGAAPANGNDRPVERIRALQDGTPLPRSVKEWNDHEELMAAIKTSQQKAITTSVWMAAALIIVAIGAGLFLLWPQAEEKIAAQGQQIESLNGEVDALGEEVKDVNMRASFLKNIVPENMERKLNELQMQAANLQNTMTQLSERAETVREGVIGPDAGSLSDRIAVLEAQFAAMTGAQGMTDLAGKIRTLEQSVSGQEQLSAAMRELQTIVDNLDTRVSSIDQELEVSQRGEGALGQTLDGVSGQDLKAAAMLIAFSQLRDSLNRQVPFEEDLQLLRNLVGEDNPELIEALDRLSPQAQNGVLTSEGLSNEFRGMTGDIVVSSLKGEDVSVMDKIKTRLSELFSVKKDGEIIGGTPTQETVNKAQQQLDAGDVQGAIATLQALEGPAAQTAEPFIQEAQATITANQVQMMLQQLILSKVGGTLGASIQQKTAPVLEQTMEGMQGLAPDPSGVIMQPAPDAGPQIKPYDLNKNTPKTQNGFRGLSPRTSE